MVQEPTCLPGAAEQPPASEPMVQEPLRPLLAAEQQVQPKDIIIPASKKKKEDIEETKNCDKLLVPSTNKVTSESVEAGEHIKYTDENNWTVEEFVSHH
jgi:hypothetical protein